VISLHILQRAIRANTHLIIHNHRTFQEHFLSPRTIFFSNQPLVWECSETSRDEWLGTVSIDYRNSLPKSQLFKELSLLRLPYSTMTDVLSTSQALGIWFTLIREYRTRILTRPADRIMAFAGIARALHNLTQFTYIAGMWAEYLPYCLLWRVRYDVERWSITGSKSRIKAEENVAQIVPSWSWFSVPISPRWNLGLDFPMRFQSHEHAPGSSNLYWATLSSFQWPSCPSNDQPPSSYYNFEGLQITLSMQICTVENLLSDGFVVKEAIVKQLNGVYNVAPVYLSFYSDTDARKSPPLPPNVRLGLLHESRSLDGSDTFRCLRMAGLCLVKGSQDGTWQRIGAWDIEFPLRSSDALWGQTSFRQIEGVETEEVTLV
jgi:hypothetical protein